ncbi:MAG: TonB C-terminal domain-containing protein [Gemmatimonadota bacterium]|nr:MAG: TonB C-terminal domain-containing protein [Gemmatimonadota bacterium]
MARLIVRRESRGEEEGVPTGAVVGSLSVHTLALLVMVWGTSRIAMPTAPQVYQVQLIAAPREAPVRAVPVPERPRPAESPEPSRRLIETRPVPEAAPREEPRAAEEEEESGEDQPQPTVEERAAAPPEQAAEGSDLPVRLEGAPFPYPEYLANIILQIKRHWRPPTGGARLRAELAFTILRDGTVEDVAWVRRSGDPAFDLEARGAIEAAGRRGAFGTLPRGYPADHLRVSFFFDPTRY